ncbi:hypothetical protein C8F01DRAFT_419990 [Mycena amicta]|nr:hypothetical protein C8F01DRAFT_419990 [Mycena amicta]
MTTLFPPPPMEHGFHASNGQHWAPTHYMPPPLHNGAFIPPQLFHDTLALSKPVERSDEPVLVKALAESCAKGESFKDSLNRLARCMRSLVCLVRHQSFVTADGGALGKSVERLLSGPQGQNRFIRANVCRLAPAPSAEDHQKAFDFHFHARLVSATAITRSFYLSIQEGKPATTHTNTRQFRRSSSNYQLPHCPQSYWCLQLPLAAAKH